MVVILKMHCCPKDKEQIAGCQCHDGDAEDALCPVEKEQITGCQCHDGDAEDALCPMEKEQITVVMMMMLKTYCLSYGDRADSRLS